jgi:hypothetical protein
MVDVSSCNFLQIAFRHSNAKDKMVHQPRVLWPRSIRPSCTLRRGRPWLQKQEQVMILLRGVLSASATGGLVSMRERCRAPGPFATPTSRKARSTRKATRQASATPDLTIKRFSNPVLAQRSAGVTDLMRVMRPTMSAGAVPRQGRKIAPAETFLVKRRSVIIQA